VARHFREVHLPNIVKSVETHTLSGAAAKQQRSPGLQQAVRIAWEDQRRFPLQVATSLSQQLAGHGLQFFKVNRTVTHVSVARPRFLDMEATPVSEGVKRIVDFINSRPKCTRRKLMESLAPAPAAPAAGAAPGPAPATTPPEAAPEQTAIASDLHWLIHEGHVIEYANGLLETAQRPLPRPSKPEKTAAPAVTPPSPSPAPAASSAMTVLPEEPDPEITAEPSAETQVEPAAAPSS